MLIHLEALFLAFFGVIATNLDNVLLVLASGHASRLRQNSMVFALILMLFILLALLISHGVELAMPRHLSLLGLIPLSIGTYELRPWGNRSAGGSAPPAGATLGLAVPLLVNSTDTLIVQTVLFSDLATRYHYAALLGAAGATVVLASIAFTLMSRPAAANRLLPLAARIRPWLLIAVGVFILLDTGFDME